tara:strand:+ start:200 stop:661 length:462 start_codon:yes stop_codon:yes gene_type:complete
MNEFKKVKQPTFLESQKFFKQEVLNANEPLFNALNVTLERTENTELIPNWEVIAANIPGVMKKRSHAGFAETEKISDTHEAYAKLVNTAAYVIASKDGWVYPDMIYSNKHEVKQAKERNASNNLSHTGRFLARFNYLLNKSQDTSSIEIPQGL